MEKLFIKNRKGEKIAVLVEKSEPQKGLAFVMHGLGGFKEQEHIVTFADAFREKGFTVVRFDTTNTFGESDGKYEDATVTNYLADLEDVIAWARGHAWYQEPFALAGHSLGGMCTALYAEKHPRAVCALAPISPCVSGQLSAEKNRRLRPGHMEQWEKTGWSIEESASRPGTIKRLRWSHMVDRLRYDLLPNVSKLTMPVLLIVGEEDTATPPEHIQMLFDVLPGAKELHIIKGAPHTFRDAKHLTEIKNIFLKWIETILK